jgi:hypothetical protein
LSNKQIKHQNGNLKRNGIVNTVAGKSWRGADNSIIASSCGTSNKGLFFKFNLLNLKFKVRKLLINAFRLCCLFVLSTLGHIFSSLTPSMQQTLERLLSKLRGSTNLAIGQDDLISSSGDGSNVAEEEDDWERDSIHYQTITSGLFVFLMLAKAKVIIF